MLLKQKLNLNHLSKMLLNRTHRSKKLKQKRLKQTHLPKVKLSKMLLKLKQQRLKRQQKQDNLLLAAAVNQLAH